MALSLVASGATGIRAEASISVSPALVELQLGKGHPSGVFNVTSVTAETMRYRVHVVHFRFSSTGVLEVVPADERSIAQWIKCNPLEFVLAPHASRAVRYTVVTPKSLAPGEYRAAVWFEPLTESGPALGDSTKVRAKVRVVTNILVPIFGQMATVEHHCELSALAATKTPGGLTIAARVANTGSGRLRVKGSYEVLTADDQQVSQGLIGDDTILPGGDRVFQQVVKGDFPAHVYKVRVRYESPKLPNVLGGQTTLGPE